MATKPHIVAVHKLVFVGKQCFSNIQILYVVYFVPFSPVCDRECFQFGIIKQGDNAQHLLVVFIVSQCLTIGIEEGDILVLRELTGEFVDIDRFVVAIYIFRNKIDDIVVLVDANHRPVHPSLVFIHKGEVGVGIVQNHAEEAIVENQVRFDE